MKVPTYAAGYDAGLSDATDGRPRTFPKLRRQSAMSYRRGYDDGYADGLARRSREAKP